MRRSLLKKHETQRGSIVKITRAIDRRAEPVKEGIMKPWSKYLNEVLADELLAKEYLIDAIEKDDFAYLLMAMQQILDANKHR